MVNFVAGTTLSAAALNTAFNTLTINTQTGSAYTLSLSDAGGLITMSNAASQTITIPANASVALPIGSQVGFLQLGAGQVSFAGAAGVTVVALQSATKLIGLGALGVAVKVGTNTWHLAGGVTP